MSATTTEQQRLESADFIRGKLFDGRKSSLQRYQELVLGEDASFTRLLVYELLTTLLAPIPGAFGLMLRKVFYRLLFREIGRGVVFGRHVTIRHPRTMRIGDCVVIDDNAVIDARGAAAGEFVLGDRVILSRGSVVKSKVGPIRIGAGTTVGSGAQIVAQGGVVVGENVSIAGGCFVSGGVDRVSQDEPGERQRYTGGPVSIGDRVHLGMGAIVLDGVTIGDDSIVQAGSVVAANVTPNTVVMGVPARVWRARTTKADPPHPVRAPSANGSSQTATAIRDYLLDRLPGAECDAFDNDESFLERELIDSAGFIELVAWVEQKFAITIDDAEIVPDHMDSVNRLAAFVQQKRDQARP